MGLLDVLGSIGGGITAFDAAREPGRVSQRNRATAEASAEEERRKRRIEDFKLRKSIIDPTDTVAMQELTEQFSDLFGVGSSVIVDESFKRAKADQEKSAEESRRIKEENAFVAKNSTPTTLLDDLVDPGEQERQRQLNNPSGLGVGVSGSFQRAKDRNRGVQDEARLLQGMGQGINTEGSISDAELRKLYSEGADGGVQNFANIQQNQSDQLKRQVGNAKANEISKVIEKISELDNMENAKALLARAKALGAIDNAVVPIQAKIDAGFDKGITSEGTGGKDPFIPIFDRVITRVESGSLTSINAKREIELKLGREMSESELAVVEPILRSNILSGVKLGETTNTRILRSKSIVDLAERLKEDLNDPNLADKVGWFDGIGTAANRFFGGSKEPKVEAFLTRLGMTKDEVARLQSGAALTPSEQEFYEALVGGIRTNPIALRARLETVQETFMNNILSSYSSALASKFPGVEERTEALEVVKDIFVPNRVNTDFNSMSTEELQRRHDALRNN